MSVVPSPSFSAGERTITEFWSSLGENDSWYQLANRIPYGLGILVYAPMYLLKVFRLRSAVRYTLTNRRLRVDRGIPKKTAEAIPLEEIDDVRVRDWVTFSRSGDLEVLRNGSIAMTMKGVRDPEAVRRTILDAVHARVEVQKVVQAQQSVPAEPVTN
jgi:hypothetical protein